MSEKEIGLSFQKEQCFNGMVPYPVTEDGIPIKGVLECTVHAAVDELTTMTIKVNIYKTLAEIAADRMTK